MLPHLYESGLYRDADRHGEALCWAVADCRGRTFERTPERTLLSKSHVLLDSADKPLAQRGHGPEAGTAQLLVLLTRGPRTQAWVLSRHALLHLPREASLSVRVRTAKHTPQTNFVLTELSLRTPEGRAWRETVAPLAAERALVQWRAASLTEGAQVFPPLPSLCSLANAAAPYEYPSKRMLAEWLKGKVLSIPHDPSLGSTATHAAGLRRAN